MNLAHLISDNLLIIIVVLAALGGMVLGAIIATIVTEKHHERAARNHQSQKAAGRTDSERMDSDVPWSDGDSRAASLARFLNKAK